MNTFRFILKNYKQKWLIAIIVPLIIFIYLTYNADNAPDREAARVACFKILEKIETTLKG